MTTQTSEQYRQVMDALERGATVLIDGATGTEVDRRGIDLVDLAWSSSGALNDPDVVRQIHEDYLRTGARVVISNTFATSRHALADAGMEDHFEPLNRDGIRLVGEAIERTGIPAVIAGGITDWSWNGNHPALDDLRRGVEQQAKIMAAAGAELLMLEMMTDVDRMSIVLDAAQQSGLPVWVGFSCTTGHLQGEPGYQWDAGEHEPGAERPPHPAPGQVRLLHGPSLAEGIQALDGKDVPVVSIMHTEVEDVDAALDIVDQHWMRRIGIYAHSGRFERPKWVFNDVISPEDYRTASARWLDRGVQVIGGCCGVGPEHMALLADLLTSR